MGRVSREQVTEYQTIAGQLEQAAKDALHALIGDVDVADEGTWSYIIDMMQQVFGNYGTNAAYLGAEWYQRCRDTETDGKTTYTATPYLNENLYGRITNETKRILEEFKSGKTTTDELTEKLELSVGNYVAKVNRDTVQENLNRENEKPAKSGRNRVDIQKEKGYRSKYKTQKVKFMRVPRADCHCAFCITMASRGAVYKTRETAGGGDPINRYHRDCRCSVVPVEGQDPIIDGYTDELNKYYDTYADAYEYLSDLWKKNPEDYTKQDADIMKRINDAHAAHEKRQKEDENLPDWKPINEVSIVMRYQNRGMT